MLALKPRSPRARQTRYCTWSPPESPLRVEYATGLPRQVHLECLEQDAAGILYGVVSSATVRVLSTRQMPGLSPVGVFASRVRGEVFLTESDLERLDANHGSVALVVAGTRAGFFVHDAGGAIQSIKSYQEFPIDVAPPPEPRRTWIAAASMILAAACLLLGFRLPARPAHPLGLAIRENAGQLRISWNSHALHGAAKLEIIDGKDRVSIPVAPPLWSAVYAIRSGDVEIRLTELSASEIARFIALK